MTEKNRALERTIIEEGWARLTPDTWVKRTPDHDKFCALTAMRFDPRTWQYVNYAAAACFPDRLALGHALQFAAAVNDHPDTTFEDVQFIYDTALAFVDGDESIPLPELL